MAAEPQTGSDGGAATHKPLFYWLLPSLWVLLVMVLALRSLLQFWPLINEFTMPEDVVKWLWFGVAVSIINLVWGVWILGHAYGRSPSFAGAFTTWQVFNIAAMLVSAAYVLLADSFAQTLSSFDMTIVTIVVGIGLIVFVKRGPKTLAPAPGARPAVVVFVVNALLGAIMGGIVLMFVGFFVGGVIADVTDMSCFEGACGFFALGIGVLGLIVGVIGGAVGAILLTGRRSRSEPS